METNTNKKWNKNKILFATIALVLVGAIALFGIYRYLSTKRYTASTFAMDTLMNQTVYGISADKAMREVNIALAEQDKRLSSYEVGSDIARINEMAGKGGADVSPETVDLLQKALAISADTNGVFSITIGAITNAWGVTTDLPRVPSDEELAALLPLVDDTMVHIEGTHVTLPVEGMAIDLGAVGKGAACSTVAAIYEKYNVKSGLASLGGSSIYAKGVKPDGTPFRIGFMDPKRGGSSYIASFHLEDTTLGVSGGYERFFEADGQKYIHIMDPRTGKPAKTDIVSVGVVRPDGAEADAFSTAMFIEGTQAALQYMREGMTALVLSEDDILYVSESLRDSFEMNEQVATEYVVEYVPGG